jgi:hypothetical protein
MRKKEASIFTYKNILIEEKALSNTCLQEGMLTEHKTFS